MRSRTLRRARNASLSVLIFSSVSLLFSQAAAPPPSPVALRAEIDTHGAKEVVKQLNSTPTGSSSPTAWDQVMQAISEGSVRYIRLAPRLAQGTDAGASEDLGISLAHALPLAPQAVLGAIDLADRPPLGVSKVCGVPFIEDTVKDLPGYIRAARTGVSKVTVSRLQPVKAACLRQLDNTAARIASHPPSG